MLLLSGTAQAQSIHTGYDDYLNPGKTIKYNLNDILIDESSVERYLKDLRTIDKEKLTESQIFVKELMYEIDKSEWDYLNPHRLEFLHNKKLKGEKLNPGEEASYNILSKGGYSVHAYLASKVANGEMLTNHEQHKLIALENGADVQASIKYANKQQIQDYFNSDKVQNNDDLKRAYKEYMDKNVQYYVSQNPNSCKEEDATVEIWKSGFNNEPGEGFKEYNFVEFNSAVWAVNNIEATKTLRVNSLMAQKQCLKGFHHYSKETSTRV